MSRWLTHTSWRPVLGGVHLEMHPDAIALTATDRYRLVTRTLVPRRPPAASWAGTLDGDDLRTASSWIRRSPMVRLDADERTLDLRTDDGTVLHVRSADDGDLTTIVMPCRGPDHTPRS